MMRASPRDDREMLPIHRQPGKFAVDQVRRTPPFRLAIKSVARSPRAILTRLRRAEWNAH